MFPFFENAPIDFWIHYKYTSRGIIAFVKVPLQSTLFFSSQFHNADVIVIPMSRTRYSTTSTSVSFLHAHLKYMNIGDKVEFNNNCR